MAQEVYNLGSLNIDRVLRVERIARPGETVAARCVALFAGGKGANQSVALRRAGAQVVHIGRVGHDGRWLIDKLADDGIDTRFVTVSSGLTGQAIIQVDDAGENSIVLSGGANLELACEDVERALQEAPAGSWLLVQNETSAVEEAMRLAHARRMRVALNPAPFDQRAREYSLDLVHLICVNETEGAALTGESSAERVVSGLRKRLPQAEVLLTLGAAGAWYSGPLGEWRSCSAPVHEVVDTTAAGDTFLGYFLAARAATVQPDVCLERACRAATWCCTRAGAMDSIPFGRELDAK
jgi:ribokinase